MALPPPSPFPLVAPLKKNHIFNMWRIQRFDSHLWSKYLTIFMVFICHYKITQKVLIWKYTFLNVFTPGAVFYPWKNYSLVLSIWFYYWVLSLNNDFALFALMIISALHWKNRYNIARFVRDIYHSKLGAVSWVEIGSVSLCPSLSYHNQNYSDYRSASELYWSVIRDI